MVAFGDGADAVDDGEVGLERLGGEAGVAGAEVGIVEARSGDLAGEEAAPEGREGDESDAVLSTPWDHVDQRVARPERELRLQRGDGMGGVGTGDLATEASERPSVFALPAFATSAIAVQVSSRGTSGSMRWSW